MTEQLQQNSLLGKIAAYTEILAKDPSSTIFVSLSEAYRKMGMLDDARQVVEHGLEIHNDSSPAHIVLARILCQQGDYVGSEASFQLALQYDSDSLAALVGYTRLSILLGREDQARELLLTARKISPADPVINKLLLSLPEKSVDPPQADRVEEVAAEDSEPVMDAVPASSLASTTLADLYLKQGLPRQALEMYRQLSLDDPDNFLLRRKIRDLEGEHNGTDNTAQEAPAAPQPEPAIEAVVEDQEPSEIVPQEGLSPAQSVAEVEPVSETISPADNPTVSGDSVLTVLDKWLDSIQQRRDDVQGNS